MPHIKLAMFPTEKHSIKIGFQMIKELNGFRSIFFQEQFREGFVFMISTDMQLSVLALLTCMDLGPGKSAFFALKWFMSFAIRKNTLARM